MKGTTFIARGISGVNGYEFGGFIEEGRGCNQRFNSLFGYDKDSHTLFDEILS